MIDRAWRALLLAVTILLVAGCRSWPSPMTLACCDRDDGSVLVGIRTTYR